MEKNFSPILSLRPLDRPSRNFKASLPILPSPPLLLSSSFFAVAANFSRENGRKTKKFAMIYHRRRLRRGAPTHAAVADDGLVGSRGGEGEKNLCAHESK